MADFFTRALKNDTTGCGMKVADKAGAMDSLNMRKIMADVV